MSKGPRLADTVHELAANMDRIMDLLKDANDPRASNEKLARAAKVSSNTVGRMRRGDGAVGIIKLSKVAKALNLHPWERLYPGIDIWNRPEVVSDQTERELLDVHRRKPPPTQH